MPTTERPGCRRCGGALPAGGRGRVPTYCSDRCRVAAHRARKAREALPKEMTRLRRWVRRDGKRPIRADDGKPASSTSPFTWAPHAVARRSPHGNGIGYVLDGGDGIVCIDLDHAVDASGKLAPWAREILDRCGPTFVETGVSGTGLHIWGRAKVWQGRRIRRPDGAHIEVYGRGRHIAIGERYADTPAAHGAYVAAKQANRADQMKFVGIDSLPHEGIAYVKEGILDATLQYPTGGDRAIEVILDIIAGKEIPKNITLGTRLFTKDNVSRGGQAIE